MGYAAFGRALQTIPLMHEMWLRYINRRNQTWSDRGQLFRAVAQVAARRAVG